MVVELETVDGTEAMRCAARGLTVTEVSDGSGLNGNPIVRVEGPTDAVIAFYRDSGYGDDEVDVIEP